jgi:hypothetical protein
LTTWVYEPHPLCQVVGMSLFSGHHEASLGWLLQLKINSTQLALKRNLDHRHCRLDYHEFMELYTYVAPLECTWLKLENHNWIYFSSDKEHDKGLVQIMVTGECGTIPLLVSNLHYYYWWATSFMPVVQWCTSLLCLKRVWSMRCVVLDYRIDDQWNWYCFFTHQSKVMPCRYHDSGKTEGTEPYSRYRSVLKGYGMQIAL